MTSPICSCGRPVGDNARFTCSCTACSTSRRGKIKGEAARWWNTARPLTRPLAITREGLAVEATQRPCNVDNCSRFTEGPRQAFCPMHRHRLRRQGTTDDKVFTHAEPHVRFWRFVTSGPVSECWEWRGGTNNHGYGRLGHAYAHRVNFEIHHRPLTEGEHVRHRCDNPPCVNPAHLEPGTVADNARDKVQRGRAPVVLNGAKITRQQAEEIRAKRATGARNVDLALEYGIHRHNISKIVTGRAWA